MKRKSLLLLPIFLIVGIVGFDGLSILSYRHWIKNALLTPPLSPQKYDHITRAVNQNFYFLDKGSSQAAFVSEDGDYVLKLFINPRFECHSWWRRCIPGLNDLGCLRKACKMRKKNLVSCINAYQLLPTETGMLYYHLTPTDIFQKKIALIDRMGGVLTVDLDRAEYYLQKKATVSSTYIKNLPIEKAKNAVKKLLSFTRALYAQGIVMVDLQLESNFGFINDEPMRLDIERLEYSPKWKTGHQIHFDMQLEEFRGWLADNYPELVECLYDQHSTHPRRRCCY